MARSATIAWPVLLWATTAAASPNDWPNIGRDPGGQRYSNLTQINAGNVNRLKPAWVFHMRPDQGGVQPETTVDPEHVAVEKPLPAPTRLASSSSTPLVVDDVMYLTTPYRRVVALAADTGKLIWAFAVPGPGQPAPRGLSYWPGDRATPARILFGTRDGRLIELDAKTGLLVPGFGKGGILDTRTPDIMRGFDESQYDLSSPPALYHDVLITGVRVTEEAGPGPSGAVRAFDVRTGKPLWTFDAAPTAGERGADTWQPGSTKNRTGSNAWGLITVDQARGIAFLPFGAATWDRYGGDRKGNNLFTTSLVAVDARTGEYLWHFQAVHHDIWDYDLGAAPILMEVTRDHRTIPAVTLFGKNGLVFILDRVTGKSIYQVAERPVPASEVPGEQASPTQPFPVITPPIARADIKADEIADVTAEHHAFCVGLQKKFNLTFGVRYQPTRLSQAMVQFPGILGGADWGGGAFDAKNHLVIVNTQDLGDIMSLEPRDGGALPYRNQRSGKYWDSEARLPCNPTPWGELIAINVDTGEIAWRSRLGVSDNLPVDKQDTGRPNMGGPIATAGGVTFIGATDDSRFRAFDSRTGKELWTAKLDASAHSIPITYLSHGKQYVAVVATGGGVLLTPTTSDALTAYSLP